MGSLVTYSIPDITSYIPDTARYTYDIRDVEAVIGGFLGAFLGLFIGLIITIGIIALLVTISKWFLFKKANRKPWESLIPVHNTIVEMEMGGLETYWYFLNFTALIPFVGLFIGWVGPVVLVFWKNIMLAKAFGKSAGYGVLLTFFPFVMYPVLAWGSAKYVGPQVEKTTTAKSKEK